MPIIGGVFMKKFLVVLAAACLVFGIVGCQQNDDVSSGQEQTSAVSNNTILPKVKEEETEAETELETTSDPQEAELNIETLADGEERDYNIEDILKNDLEIDGISITIPCTLNELLKTLGDDYKVKKNDIKDSVDGNVNRKFKDFTGEFIVIDLYCNGDDTLSTIQALIANPQKIDYDTINVIGYFSGSGRHKGYLSLPDLTQGDSLDKCLKNYGKPNEVDPGENGRTYLTYSDSQNCFIQIEMIDNVVYKIWAEFETENLED